MVDYGEVERQVKASIAADAAAVGHMSMGEVLDALNLYRPDRLTAFDAEDVGSYRGYYDQFYIGDGSSTVKEVSEALEFCIGERFYGYKGGEFLMGEDTRIWLAEYGDTGMRICGLVVIDGKISPVLKEN